MMSIHCLSLERSIQTLQLTTRSSKLDMSLLVMGKMMTTRPLDAPTNLHNLTLVVLDEET